MATNTTPTILDEVKKVLRITHTKLDTDITDKIAAARAEMTRVGILEEKANATDDYLINEAIKTYIQQKYAKDEKEAENYYNSWVTQVDGMRKSSGYRNDGSQQEE